MAVVFPYVRNPTWADGSGGATPISAAKLNLIDDGILNAHQQPAVRVFHNANQSISTATLTALAFNSERFDQAGGSASTMHDTATNNTRLTCRYAGVYLISGSVEWANGTTGIREISCRIGGSTYIADATDTPASVNVYRQTITTLYSLAVNDYVELVVQQNSGAGLNVVSSSAWTPEFMMVRVG